MLKRYYFIILIASVTFIGCEKGVDLPRDNPYDISNPNYVDSSNTINESPELVFSKYEITKEVVPIGNSPNGQINKEEYIYLLVYVKNTGNAKAESVKGTITTSNNYISMTTDQLIFAEGTNPNSYPDYISANTEGTARKSSFYTDVFYSISFEVSNSVPDSTNINFNIEMQDKNGITWSDNFEITVY